MIPSIKPTPKAKLAGLVSQTFDEEETKEEEKNQKGKVGPNNRDKTARARGTENKQQGRLGAKRKREDDEKKSKSGGSKKKTEVTQSGKPVLPWGIEDVQAALAYYTKSFPSEGMFRLLASSLRPILSGQTEDKMRNLEFTFEFNVATKKMSRFWGLESEEELSKMMTRREVPLAVHIGPRFSCASFQKDYHGTDTVVTDHFLVFDVDIKDYGPALRPCCGDSDDICFKCSSMFYAPMRVLEFVLESMGYGEKTLFFFSGRKGFHCWVFDPDASSMSELERAQLVSKILTPFKPKKGVVSRGYSRKSLFTGEVYRECIRGNLSRLWKIMGYGRSPAFLKFFVNSFLTPRRDEALGEGTEEGKKLAEGFDSVASRLEKLALKSNGAMGVENPLNLLKFMSKHLGEGHARSIMEDLECTASLPALDCAVTQSMMHLLKMPWCIHPKSRRIAIPITPKDVRSPFDPKSDFFPCSRDMVLGNVGLKGPNQRRRLKELLEGFSRDVERIVKLNEEMFLDPSYLGIQEEEEEEEDEEEEEEDEE